MGAGCNCSKTTEYVTSSVESASASPLKQPSTPSESTAVPQLMQELQEYVHVNETYMHKKMQELYRAVIISLDQGVKVLKLNVLKMKDKDWAQFTHLLTYSKNISTLHLWKVSLSVRGLDMLSSHLFILGNLTSLTLCDVNLSSYYLLNFAEGLQKLTKLKKLNLAVNYLTHEHMTALLNPIVGMKELESLELDENELGDKGAAMCAQIMEALPVLREISLKFNSIGHSGFRSLVECVTKKRNFTLYLDGNDLNDDEYDELEKAINISAM